MLPYRKEAAEEADSKAAFIRIHLPGHSVSAAVLWGYLRIQCAIVRFPTPHIGQRHREARSHAENQHCP